MFTKLGFISILAGGFVGIFTIISGFMQADNIWIDITLSTVTGGLADTIVNAFSGGILQDGLSTLFYDIPLGGVIIGLGVIFLLISLFFKEN